MSEDESGEGSASSADEEPVDQDEDSQTDLNVSMQEMNVQQVRFTILSDTRCPRNSRLERF